MKKSLGTTGIAIACCSLLTLSACSSGDGSSENNGASQATSAAADATKDSETASATESSENADGKADGQKQCSEPAPNATTIDTKANEPKLSLPVPEDWKRDTQMDSEMIRYRAIKATSPESYSSVVVTMEDSPAEVTEKSAGLEQIAQKGSIKAEPKTQICGFDSQRIDYISDFAGGKGNDATALLINVPSEKGFKVIVVTIQATKGNDAEFQKAREDMVKNVHISAPANSSGTANS